MSDMFDHELEAFESLLNDADRLHEDMKPGETLYDMYQGTFSDDWPNPFMGI